MSNTWVSTYDFRGLNPVPVDDWNVEHFKEKPNALVFRFFNIESRQLQQLSLFLKTETVFLSHSFTESYVAVSDIGGRFTKEFKKSVGLDLQSVLECMYIALPYVKCFNRF